MHAAVLVAVLAAAGMLSACGSNVMVVATRPDVVNATKLPTVGKDSSSCLDPVKVLVGVEYTCADGKKRKGILRLNTPEISVIPCSKDNEKGCLTTKDFTAFATVEREKIFPGRIQAGIVLAGVTGTLTSAGPAECASDGELACVTTAGFPAASASGLASKVLSGQVVAGVTGNVTLPATTSVLASASYGISGNSATGSLETCSTLSRTGCYNGLGWTGVETINLTAGNIRSGFTLGDVAGGYPSASHRLASADNTTDLTSLAASSAAGSYEFFDSAGTRYTGTISDAGAISIGTASQAFNISLYRQFTVPGDTDLVAGNVVSGVNILGIAGSLVLPSASDVRGSVAYGPASASTGSYSPDLPDAANVRANDTVGGVSGTLADCTTDGANGCVVPSSGAIKAADTTNFTGWDIRKKRNQTTGTVLTFAGISGQSKSCRNRANTTIWDNNNGATVPSADSHSPLASTGLDIFDTIDDQNNGTLGLPLQVPTWTVINATDYGRDFACGGIYATGSVATGNTGADATLAHDTDGNWQDLTPGVKPGGANSTNTANGCNATDKHCVFKELITGLMVTEVSAATYTWVNAIDYCDKLGQAGSAITSPIPVIGGATYDDWRLPTTKELMNLSVGGIRGLNQTSSLVSTYGNVDDDFWTSTTVSNETFSARSVNMYNNSTYKGAKSYLTKLVCVR